MAPRQSEFQTRLHDAVTTALGDRSLPTSAMLVDDLGSVTLASLPVLQVRAKRDIDGLRPEYLAAAISIGPVSDDELLDMARDAGYEQGRRKALIDLMNVVGDLDFSATLYRKPQRWRSRSAASLIANTRIARELIELTANRNDVPEPSIINTEAWMADNFGYAARSTGYKDGYHETGAAVAERFSGLLTLDETSTLSEQEYLDLMSQFREHCDSLLEQSGLTFAKEQTYLNHSRVRYLDTALIEERRFAQAVAVATETRESAVRKAIAPFQSDFELFVEWVASHSNSFDARRDTLPLAEAALTWRDTHEHKDLGRFVFGTPFEEIQQDQPWTTVFQHVVRDAGITNLAWRDLGVSVAN